MKTEYATETELSKLRGKIVAKDMLGAASYAKLIVRRHRLDPTQWQVSLSTGKIVRVKT